MVLESLLSKLSVERETIPSLKIHSLSYKWYLFLMLCIHVLVKNVLHLIPSVFNSLNLPFSGLEPLWNWTIV